MTPYSDTIILDGRERIVDILQIGRVALVFQTANGEETGWYNKATRQWEHLGDEYTVSVRNGLKMARKQLTTGLFVIPVIAPGDA